MNKKIILPIAVVLAAAGGTYACRSRDRGERPTLYGNVDIREVSLAFRVGGRITEIKVDEGDPVHAGDLIASLDPEPLQHAVANAEAAVAATGAHAAMLHKGYRSEDVEQARGRLEAARAALRQAEQQLVRQKAMVPPGAAPQRTLDDAQSQHDQAAAQMRIADQSLRELTAGYRKEEIAEADGQFQQAQATLATARLNLRDAQLTAPSDGIILTRAVEKGSMVASGTPGFSLTLTHPVWARAYVDEAHLGRFSSGTQVLLTTDLHPDKPYHGVVGFVSPTSEFTPKTVETPDLRTSLVYRLRIVVADADAQLRQGMPVTVRLAR
ncbi:MAG: secretion protein HlyD [Holophaga sp.]|nr:secretion protein HlyD [Holophaga sp.]